MLRSDHSAKTVVGTFVREMKNDQGEMRRLIPAAVKVLSDEYDPESITSTLRSLRLRLNQHFYLEEAFGYFEEELSDQPWLGGAVQRLRDEHESLSGKMDHIVCQSLARPRADVHQLRADFADFLVCLRQHEQRENELIMTAFNDEVGVCD